MTSADVQNPISNTTHKAIFPDQKNKSNRGTYSCQLVRWNLSKVRLPGRLIQHFT